MAQFAEVTVRVLDLPEVQELLKVAFALDDNIAEFGYLDWPEWISDSYQRFHDMLRLFKRPSA